MTWTKLDDLFHAHPKVLAAWAAQRGSIGLHAMALSHAGAFLTDGHVQEAWVNTHLPRAPERQRIVRALIDAGLWEPVPGGWQIHDYLDCNESREQVLSRRAGLAPARAPAPPGARTRAPAGGRPPARPVPSRPTPDPFLLR